MPTQRPTPQRPRRPVWRVVDVQADGRRVSLGEWPSEVAARRHLVTVEAEVERAGEDIVLEIERGAADS